MKPIKLEISGFSNYREKIEIDFEKLTERSVFGIFGRNGSGKSSILDAIIVSIYGIKSGNDREYINSNCDKAKILFEFEIGDKNSITRYQIQRTIIQSEKYEKNSKAILIELHINGGETIIADNVSDVNLEIINILGLTESEFIKSVIIPQNKFNDFLKLKGNEKKDILEKMFNLEKYGKKLITKVRIKKENEMQKEIYIKKELEKYKDVNDVIYNKKEKELEDLKNQKNNISNELEILIKTHQENKFIYEQQNKLEKYEARKKELDIKADSMQIKKKQLEDAVNSEKINPHILTIQNLEKKIETDNYKFEFLQKKLENLNQEFTLSKIKYEEIYKIKNEKLPKLSEDKIRLERSKELNKELINIEKELKFLKENREKLNNEKNYLKKVKSESQGKYDVLVKSIKEIGQNITKLKVNQDSKQKILMAYEYEKEYNKIVEKRDNKRKKFEELNKELDELNLKNKYLERDLKNTVDRLNVTTEEYEKILKKCPGKFEDVLQKTEYIISLKAKLECFKENEIIKNNTQKELNEIIEKKYANEREVKVENEKLEYIKRNISNLEEELEKLKYLNLAVELRKELKEDMPCPVCGSRHHTTNDSNNDIKIIITKEKLDKLKLEENSTKIKLENLNTEIIGSTILEKVKSKQVEELKYKLGENSSSEMNNKLLEEQRILSLLKDSIKKWNIDKENISINVSKLYEEKYKIEKEEIRLKEVINTLKVYVLEIKDYIEELDERFKVVESSYKGLKSTLKISNLYDKIKEINKNEKTIEDLNEQYIKINKNKEDEENVIRKYQNELHQLELELIKNNEKYEEKYKAKEEKYLEVTSITKGESASVLLNNIEEKIKEVITKEEIIKNKLEEQRVEYDKYSSEKSNIEGQLRIFKEEKNTQESILNQLLIDYKFENLYAVKRALLDPDHSRLLYSEIMEYEEEQKILNIKIRDMKDLLLGKRVKKEEFINEKDKIYSLRVEHENISNEIESNQGELLLLKENIKSSEKLEKELILIKNKVRLLQDLYESIESKQFVEYIATSKLQSITQGANKKLEKMTRGRYNLEIDSSIEFIIRDNLNGGKTRSVDTLSGGEEFLVSLALALEVSSQIKLKGGYPLECMFIDEGFGALDEENIKIIIESIERLQYNNLKIGIISHIKEIKDWVQVKLLIEESKFGDVVKVYIE